MKIIKETNRKLVEIGNYVGVCDGCGTPLEYDERFRAIEIEKKDDFALVVPIDILVCPNCNHTIGTMTLYNLDVTKQLEEIKRKQVTK